MSSSPCTVISRSGGGGNENTGYQALHVLSHSIDIALSAVRPGSGHPVPRWCISCGSVFEESNVIFQILKYLLSRFLMLVK